MKATWILAIALVFGLATMAQAQPQQRGQYGQKGQNNATFRGQNMQHPMAFLDLSDDQKAQIEKMQLDHRKKAASYKLDIEEKRIELKRLTLADNVDQKALDKKIDEIFALKATMVKEGVSFHNSVRSVLTDDQKAKFDARKGTIMGEGKGKRHGHKQARSRGYAQGAGFGHGPQYARANCPRLAE